MERAFTLPNAIPAGASTGLGRIEPCQSGFWRKIDANAIAKTIVDILVLLDQCHHYFSILAFQFPQVSPPNLQKEKKKKGN